MNFMEKLKSGVEGSELFRGRTPMSAYTEGFRECVNTTYGGGNLTLWPGDPYGKEKNKGLNAGAGLKQLRRAQKDLGKYHSTKHYSWLDSAKMEITGGIRKLAYSGNLNRSITVRKVIEDLLTTYPIDDGVRAFLVSAKEPSVK